VAVLAATRELNGSVDEYTNAERVLSKASGFGTLPLRARKALIRIRRAASTRGANVKDLMAGSFELEFLLTSYSQASGFQQFRQRQYREAVRVAQAESGESWSQFILALAALSSGASDQTVAEARAQLVGHEGLEGYRYALELREHVRGNPNTLAEAGEAFAKSMLEGDVGPFRSLVETSTFPKDPQSLYKAIANIELRSRGLALLATCTAYESECPTAWKKLTFDLLLPIEQPNLPW
jgi:hypothetical protein